MSAANGKMYNGNGVNHGNGTSLMMSQEENGSLAKKLKMEIKSHNQCEGLEGKTFKDMLPWSGENSEVTDEFIQKTVEILTNFIHETYNRDSKVIDFRSPEDVVKEIDFEVKDDGANLNELLNVSKKALDLSVKTGHPHFFNQLFAGLDITGLMGQWIGTTANTSMYTYEMSPVFGTMEKSVLKKMLEIVGFKNGDGMLFPGGSISNMQSMNVARYKFNPNIKEEGLFGMPRLALFASEEAHYSTMKAAATLGLGTKSVKKIKTDENGKMILEDLRAQIISSQSQGERPFYVCATSGTTVAGAFDRLEEIADICSEFGLWFHVDAAWGGGALLSKKYKHLLKGIERADSATWNPHKLMSVPVQCSVLLIKEHGLLQQCNKAGAKYLFQQDKKLYNAVWDTGDKTFQCGRPNDAFKLWLMWKAKGTRGFEAHIDRAFDNSRYLAEQIKRRDGFELLIEPQCTNVCFRYIPPSLTNMPDGPEKMQRLHKIPPEIKKRMTLKGSMMVGYQPLKDHVNFFRMIVISSVVTHEDMDFVLDEIERLGKDL
ncbi:acidic amino acid decarboxylase GADL1-like [Rhopilema esculentum]|uniref:acidic amino acid decarboxylase GADL1-like n=1 Tax=Rhopilema esculentum TaxID=499914 RepID=UPI0031D71A53|eukprot:gene14227-5246_t